MYKVPKFTILFFFSNFFILPILSMHFAFLPMLEIANGSNIRANTENIRINKLKLRNQITKLIENGGDLNAPLSKTEDAPLLRVAYNEEDADLLELLLKNGADPNITRFDGNTPLHNAVNGSNLIGVEILLKYGAKVDAENWTGRNISLLYCSGLAY